MKMNAEEKVRSTNSNMKNSKLNRNNAEKTWLRRAFQQRAGNIKQQAIEQRSRYL